MLQYVALICYIEGKYCMHKKYICRCTAIAVLVILTVIGLCSCGNKDASGYGLTEKTDGSLILVLPEGVGQAAEIPVKRLEEDISSYTVVYSKTAGRELSWAASAVQDALTGITDGLSLFAKEIVADGTDVGTKKIIVSAEGSSDSMRTGDFSIYCEGGNLVMNAGSETAVIKAANMFAEYFIDKDNNTILLPDGAGYTYHADYICDAVTINDVPITDYRIEAGDESVANSILTAFVEGLTGYESSTDESSPVIIFEKTAEAGCCSVQADGSNIVIYYSDEVGADSAARFFTSVVINNGGIDIDKTAQAAEVTLSEVQSITAEEIKALSPITLYVATNGDDSAAGTKASPLATMEGARLRARSCGWTTPASINVVFRGGEYTQVSPVFFDEADSGTSLSPVTYAAYDGETVNIYGGYKIDASLITKAENTETVNNVAGSKPVYPELTVGEKTSVIDRVIDDTAKENLMQIDLCGLVDHIPNTWCWEYKEENADFPTEIFINGTALENARYPNSQDNTDLSYLRTVKNPVINDDGSKTIFFDDETAERANLWSEDTYDDLRIFGYLKWDWQNDRYVASDIDTEEQSVTIYGGTRSAFSNIDSEDEDRRYYFFNIPEEIDVPGEYYIDRESRILYFYPPDNFSADDVYISILDEAMLQLYKTADITFENLNFGYTRGFVMDADEVESLTLQNCTMKHIASVAACLDGMRITVSGCEICDTAIGGISITGGDIKNLISAESVLENSEIYNIGRNRCATVRIPGFDFLQSVYVKSVGLVVRNNELHDNPGLIMEIHSNDVIVEYNEIYNAVTDYADAGAVGTGHMPWVFGDVIRYNFFHDIGNPYGSVGTTAVGQQAIHIDDGHTGWEIYGNVFWNGAIDFPEDEDIQNAAVWTHASQFSHIYNNIIIGYPYAYKNVEWETVNVDGLEYEWDWMRFIYTTASQSMLDYGVDSELWREHYEGTIWEQTYDYVTNEWLTAGYNSMTEEEFKQYVKDNKWAPVASNVIDENVFVDDMLYPHDDMTNSEKDNIGSCTQSDNYATDDTSIFKSFGEDFALTDEALVQIREVIPDFENIPFDKIGIQK